MNPMLMSLLQGPNPTFPQVGPAAPAPAPAANPATMGGFLGNPLTSMGLGLLGGNYGRNSKAAFANAMKGGLVGLESARRNQLVQAQHQMAQSQFQMAQEKAKREEEARKRRQAYLQQHAPELATAPAELQDAWMKQQYAQPKLTDDQSEYEFAKSQGYNGTFMQYMNQVKKPLVDMTTQQMPTREFIQREDAIASAKADRDWNAGIIKQASSARGMLPTYRRARHLLESVNTGTLEVSKLEAKKLANALGLDFDPSQIASAEELQVYLGDQLMSRVAETKGAVSNKEMELFERFSGSFGKTTEGNKAIIDFKIAQAERDMRLARMSRAMRKKGSTSEEIRVSIEDYIDNNDISGLLVMPDSQGPTQGEIDALLEKYK